MASTVSIHVRIDQQQFDALRGRALAAHRKIIDQIRCELDEAQRLHEDKIADGRRLLGEPVYDEKADFGA